MKHAVRSARRAASDARAERQRTRILDAAEQHFIGSGFHAASMAQIATTAAMSAGLIYRYFDGKSAIVKAIIERHLEGGYKVIAGLNSPADISSAMLDVVEHWRRRDDPKMNAVLFLELTAQSTRDAKIAAAVRNKDRAVGASLAPAMLRSAKAHGTVLTPAQARGRAVILLCLVEGLALRAVRDPTLQRAMLRPVLDKIIMALMS